MASPGCVSLLSQDLSELRTSCFLRADCLATIQVVRDATLLGGDMTGVSEECVFVHQLDQKRCPVASKWIFPREKHSAFLQQR